MSASLRDDILWLMFERQIYHLIFLLVTVIPLWFYRPPHPSSFFGIESTDWFHMALIAAMVHSIYVWLFWRLELHYKRVTKDLGEMGFNFYVLGFFILFAFRFITIWGLAISDQNSIYIPKPLALTLLAILVILSHYGMYSVIRYFGMKRATGADHFYEKYRNMPLVKKGMFKYCSNTMYTFVFMVFWCFGLLYSSQAALVAAAFSHIYIWVHYYCTEKPDMKKIYG